MDGKQYFREVCKQNGIDCDTYFKVRAQNNENNAGFVCKCHPLERKPTHLFLVNYLRSLDAYVAWNLKASKAGNYNTFRVLKENFTRLEKGKLLPIIKSLEYSGWDEEIVYAFDRAAIELFLNKCFLEIRRI